MYVLLLIFEAWQTKATANAALQAICRNQNVKSENQVYLTKR